MGEEEASLQEDTRKTSRNWIALLETERHLGVETRQLSGYDTCHLKDPMLMHLQLVSVLVDHPYREPDL